MLFPIRTGGAAHSNPNLEPQISNHDALMRKEICKRINVRYDAMQLNAETLYAMSETTIQRMRPISGSLHASPQTRDPTTTYSITYSSTYSSSSVVVAADVQEMLNPSCAFIFLLSYSYLYLWKILCLHHIIVILVCFFFRFAQLSFTWNCFADYLCNLSTSELWCCWTTWLKLWKFQRKLRK